MLSVTWSGIADPTTIDHLRVCRLGSPGGVFCEVDAWWSTDAAPGGVLLLELPADLEPGWYEVRLMSPDARDYDILKPIARSGPILVSGSQSIAFSRGEQSSTSVLWLQRAARGESPSSHRGGRCDRIARRGNARKNEPPDVYDPSTNRF